MTPEQAAHETREAIVRGTGRFMTDADVHAHGAALGFTGMDFYVAGRGGGWRGAISDGDCIFSLR